MSATTSAAADTTPPATIENLAAGNETQSTIQLTWTAPGDDGSTGTAAQYDVRYSFLPITGDAEFETASQAQGEPAPQPAGTPETFTVTNLSPGTTYYFAIKTADEVPNWSALSNIINTATQP